MARSAVLTARAAGILDGGEQIAQVLVVLARGDADDTLARSRDHAVRIEHHGNFCLEAEAA